MKLQLKYIDPITLEENPRNWRRHPDGQIFSLRESIKKVGWAGAALFNKKTGHLIDGHLRKNEAIQRGELLPVLVGDWTPEQEKYILATLDPIGDLADFDESIVRQILEEVKVEMPDTEEILSLISTELELDDEDAEAEEVDTPEPPANPVTKPGDLYILDKKHRILCGDSTKAESFELLMDGKKAHMIFTDPPYGVDYEGSYRGKKWDKIANDDAEDIGKFLRPVLQLIVKHSRNPSSYYFCTADRTAHKVLAQLEVQGIHFAVPIVWVKNRFSITWDRYHPQHETILYCGEGSKPTGKQSIWYGPTNETTVWNIDLEPSCTYQHPTQKPVKIPARAIRNSSRRGDIILDPFLGSGSTLVAAAQLERVCYGVELEPKYCDAVVERYRNMRTNADIEVRPRGR